MTRKEAWHKRVQEITELLFDNGVCLSNRECEIVDGIIAAHLQHVEREVWEKAAHLAETEGVYPELNCALGGPAWYQHGKRIAAKLRQQQEGL